MKKSNNIYRWSMWLLLAAAYAITHFHRANLNVLADRLMDEFSLSAVAMGNLAAAYSYMYLLLQVPGGLIIDRFGSRRVGFVTIFLMGAGSLIFGFSSSVAGIFLGRLLIGLGGSVIFVSLLRFQGAWFSSDEFAFMSGLVIFVGGLGSLAATFPLAYVITLIRWQLTFQVAGVAAIALSFLCLFLLKESPEGTGPVQGGRGVKPAGDDLSLWRMLILTIGNRSLWIPFLVFFGTWGSFLTFTGAWGITSLMQIYHLSKTQAALIMLPAMVGMIVGAPATGYLSDRLKSRKKIIAFSALFFFANWSLFVIFGGQPPLPLLYVIGFSLGFSVTGTSVMMTYVKEISPPALTATSIGLVNSGSFTGTALLQLLFGYILQRGWQGLRQEGIAIYPVTAYCRAYLCCLLVAGLAAILSLFMTDEKEFHLENKNR